MNKNNYHRRSLLKRGLIFLGGLVFMGATRASMGGTKTPQPHGTTRRVVRGRGAAQHCIEGVSLGFTKVKLN